MFYRARRDHYDCSGRARGLPRYPVSRVSGPHGFSNAALTVLRTCIVDQSAALLVAPRRRDDVLCYRFAIRARRAAPATRVHERSAIGRFVGPFFHRRARTRVPLEEHTRADPEPGGIVLVLC